MYRSGRYEQVTPRAVSDLLGLVGINIKEEETYYWGSKARVEAATWAYASYVNLPSVIPIPKRPAILDQNTARVGAFDYQTGLSLE